MLLTGKSAAIPGHDLVECLGLKDTRELTRMIEQERRAGAPICAATDTDNHGYYLAQDANELEQYIKSLSRRLHHVGQTRNHLETTLMRMTGQEKIGGC